MARKLLLEEAPLYNNAVLAHINTQTYPNLHTFDNCYVQDYFFSLKIENFPKNSILVLYLCDKEF